MVRKLVSALVLAAAVALTGCGKGGGGVSGTEPASVAIGIQNGVAYIPFHVMQDQGLVEKHARRLGVTLEADYRNLGQAAFVRDALLADQIQFGVAGPPTLVTMHEKTGGDIKAMGAVVSVPIWVNTTNPKVKTVCDFSDGDKIAVATVKSSVQAVTLQMMTKAWCGDPFRDDRFTVSMPHPDAYNALMSGTVSAHMATPPFAVDEIENGKGKVRRIASSYDVLGGKGTLVFLITSERWRTAHPKAYEAVRAAFEEAEAWVRAHPREAAETYLRIEKPRQPVEEVLKQVTMPEVVYGTDPVALGKYAAFMHEIGTVKRAYGWQDLSMPELRSRPGS
jgi:NitT/TauT family transport system substrate-binding protein